MHKAKKGTVFEKYINRREVTKLSMVFCLVHWLHFFLAAVFDCSNLAKIKTCLNQNEIEEEQTLMHACADNFAYVWVRMRVMTYKIKKKIVI